MKFLDNFQKAFVEPFPLEEVKQLVYSGGTVSLGWRGSVYLVFGYRVVESGIRFLARDAWGVICYLSEEGGVSYPGDGSGRVDFGVAKASKGVQTGNRVLERPDAS